MNSPEVLIHINENINKSKKDKLEEQLNSLDGVIKPKFSQEKEHLLFVSYDSDTINATKLLNKIKENNFNSQLVGL